MRNFLSFLRDLLPFVLASVASVAGVETLGIVLWLAGALPAGHAQSLAFIPILTPLVIFVAIPPGLFFVVWMETAQEFHEFLPAKLRGAAPDSAASLFYGTLYI